MEAHPVPQNVTSFEFRLIGDMTLKQFLYLGSGVGLAYLLFITIAAKFPFVAWPLIAIFSLLGIAYAFIPIQDRPLDHWTGAFLKAILDPTKRVWRKNNKDLTGDPIFRNRLNIYLQGTPLPQTNKPILPPLPQVKISAQPVTQSPVLQPIGPLHPVNLVPNPTKSITPAAQPTPSIPVIQTTAESLPTPNELGKTVELGKQAQTLQHQIIETEKKLAEIKQKAAAGKEEPHQITLEFNQIFENLQKLTQEASIVKQQLATVTKQPIPTLSPVKVEVVAPIKPKIAQISLTSAPNVINGIVSDHQGNYLDGVVIVIHDKDGLPVRALKTNKLGQFTGSTPLLNGTYTIEIEKDNFTFDVLKIELEGKTLPPLLITAKTAAVS